jgi:uncharacterized protein YndB with AHSA1/START domain
MFDQTEELTALHRDVTIDDAAGTVSVTLTRHYGADVDEVWDALTDPERLARWFYPISGDLEVGGRFQLEGNAGGEIRACERPNRIEVAFGGPDSVVVLNLAGNAGQTALEMVHSVPLAMAGSGAGALFVGPGWDGAFLGLGLHLRGEDPQDPLAFAGSEEVITFNRGSIAHWTQAIESSGTATAEEIAGGRKAAIAQYTPQG